VVLEEGLLDLLAVDLPHRLVLPAGWEVALEFRCLGGSAAAIQNCVLLELENHLHLSGFGGSFVRMPSVQKAVVRGRVANFLMRKVGEKVVD
jgi:hypothetical protein